MAVSLLHTDRAFRSAHENGGEILGSRGTDTKLRGLQQDVEAGGCCVGEGGGEGPGFGEMSPAVMRRRRVRKVAWERDVQERVGVSGRVE
ncbi:unnamed protein product [Staurois parvus]|uniref:Uncharacterized protein n=1 Tax=Staurois parvus TaxID=386267 RepID=A0ABN9DN99_9NEOB|nr:unnamed protein product [Staurois parvus]